MSVVYTIPCPLCVHVVRCHDSMSDARQELDDHLLKAHPDAPDPTHDPRFPPPPASDRSDGPGGAA